MVARVRADFAEAGRKHFQNMLLLGSAPGVRKK